MDFDRLLDEASQAAPTEPRELYAWLPDKSEGYGYLRDVQGQVLTTWHKRRGERDLIIKVNTGSGKTINGLVILQSYLHDNEGPALYVAPNKYLAAQVREEARRIGIVTTDDVDSSQYRGGEAIGVVNIWKLFNGRSVFRHDRYPSKPVPIGAVVIDDAHAALDTARSSLSIAIKRDSADNKTPEGKLFADLLNLFREDLTNLSPNALLDVDEKSFGALARIPFWAWRSRLAQVRKRLHQDRELEALKYSWPAVKDVLQFCRTVFTSTGVTITPLCSPVSQISNFHNATHRIYLTATLADDSVLVTDFGADPTSVSVPITPTTAGDIGERMILAPMELNPEISAAEVRAHILTLAEDYNTVVIVPSNSVAAEWEQLIGDPSRIIRADDVSDIVTRLRSGKHVGLVVLVNKYDGIDLPGDACRILVLDGLPEAFSGEERLETQLTSRESGTDDRQVQRIEQGMGRGVRSNEDHCVVLLLGARLTQLVADPDTFALFSPATQEQLKQSRRIASGLVDKPLSEIMGVALQALTRDAGWVRFARQGLASIAPAVGHVSPAATHRRAAFEAATAGKITDATEELGRAVASTTDSRQQGWLLEQQATYIDQYDPARAQEVLAAAREKNPAVLRPLSGVEYRKISASVAQATAARDYLTETYGTDRIKLRVGFEALLDALRFDPSQTAVEAFEQAFCDLGLHLGFNAQRPERDIGRGPDVLWALGDLKYWVTEAKSGAVVDYIGKVYINQLTGSKLWFDGYYDDTVTAVPVMIHPAERLGKDATALPGARVITTRKLDDLKDAVRA